MHTLIFNYSELTQVVMLLCLPVCVIPFDYFLSKSMMSLRWIPAYVSYSNYFISFCIKLLLFLIVVVWSSDTVHHILILVVDDIGHALYILYVFFFFMFNRIASILHVSFVFC